MVIANLLLNALVIVLLGLTIGYCWLLNRRIQVLQDSKSELAQLLKHFDESTERASESIIALQTASKKIGENIQHRIDKANFLLDDMAFMIEKGGKIANQMEAGFAVSRARRAAEPPQSAEEKSAPQPSRERTAASLEAVLGRLAGRRPAPQEEDPLPSPRSKSEQELLAMLKTGIKG